MGVKIRLHHNKNTYILDICNRGHRSRIAGGTLEQAKEKAKEISKKIKAGTFFFRDELDYENSTVSLQTYYERFLAERRLKDKTLSMYETVSIRIFTQLGHLDLNKITRRHCKDFVAYLMSPRAGYERNEVKHCLSKDSIRLHVSCLRKVLNEALEEELIVKNPALKLGDLYKDVSKMRQEIQPLNETQMHQFLAAVKESFAQYYGFYVTLCYTGMRCGEAEALRWMDVDFVERIIHIRRSGIDAQTTKTGHRRKIEMSDFLFEVLTKHRDSEIVRFKGLLPVHVFTTAGQRPGCPVAHLNLRESVFLPALKNANLPQIRQHDLRHSFASQHMKMGTPLLWIQRMLGHSTPTMTLNTYGHLMKDSSNRDNANAIAAPTDKKLKIAK